MPKHIIPNPPSHEAALELLKRAKKTRKFQITPATREAIANAVADHYEELMTYLQGGKITGSKLADAYQLARYLIQWEAELGNVSLHAAIERREILLNDIVKRIPSELKKLGFAVDSWVCTGQLIEKIEPEEDTVFNVVNG